MSSQKSGNIVIRVDPHNFAVTESINPTGKTHFASFEIPNNLKSIPMQIRISGVLKFVTAEIRLFKICMCVFEV